MKMTRLNIQLTADLKAELDALKPQGISIAGFIRHVLTERFKQPRKGSKAK